MTTTVPFQNRRIVFSNGSIGEPMKIETANPLNYHQVLNNLGNAPKVHIWAQLFRPPRTAHSPRLLPAIMIVPGSLGVAESHLAHAETLCAMGFIVLVLDPFGARGVSSTVANQVQYSFAASALDVLSGLRVLQALPDVDPTRIGAQGHSRGGAAVFLAAMKRFADPVLGPKVPPLRAVYAAYPWCGHQFDDPDSGTTRIRMLVGEKDEWCSPSQVQAAAHSVKLRGGDASFRLVPGAHHSFDRETPITNVKDASVSPNAPTVYLANDGSMIHPVTGVASAASTDRDLMVWAIKAGYGVKGAKIGGADGSAALFREDMKRFWKEALMDGGGSRL